MNITPGYFRAIDKRTKKELGRIKYSSVTTSLKRQLYAQADSLCFYCCCTDKPIEMKISKDLRIYPAKNNIGELHSPFCPKRIDKNMQKKLWEIQKEGKLYFHCASHDANARDFMLRLNDVTYKRLISPTYRMPDNYVDFNKRIFATQKYIKTSYNKTLSEICLSSFKIEQLELGKEYFIYGTFLGYKETDFDDSLLYVDMMDYFGKKYRFYIDKGSFNEVFREGLSKDYKMAIGGFLYKRTEKSKILTFSDFWITPIDDLGLFFLRQ